VWLRTPREEIAFTARPKIQSQSQIFRYGQSIFCLPHRPNFSVIFDLCIHWVSVVRVLKWKKIGRLGWFLKLKIDFENQILTLFDSYFWPFNNSQKKSNPFLWSVQSYLQSEMFLSNSVDMMKNLQSVPHFCNDVIS